MIKRLILLVLIAVTTASCKNSTISNPLVVTLEAQTFPVTLHFEHQPNDPADNVTTYLIHLDNGADIPYPNTVNSACVCIKSADFVVNDSNQHSITVTALNIWGSSAPLVVQFKVQVPAKVVNGVVKPGA